MHASTCLNRIRLLALVLFVVCPCSFAQSLHVGAYGGLVILDPFEGEAGIFTMPVGKMGFGFGPEAPAIGVEVKYASPKAHITLAAGVSYTPLSGNGVPEWLDENPYTTTRIDTKAQLYTASLGAQWELVRGPVRPYLGARLLFSYMPYVEEKKTITTGGIRYDDIGEPSGVLVYQNPGIHRIGFGFLAGGEFDLVPRVSLDLSARYHVANLFPERAADYGAYFKSFTVGLGLLYEVLQ